MKTLAKDVILLCKGWYDKKKYPSILKALQQYYRVHYDVYDIPDTELTEKYLLQIVLAQAVREIVTDYPDRMRYFINSSLLNDDLFLGLPGDTNEDYYYQMFYRIRKFFSCLQMHGDGFTDIDTTDYFDVVEGEYGEERVLKEDIIEREAKVNGNQI